MVLVVWVVATGGVSSGDGGVGGVGVVVVVAGGGVAVGPGW